MVKTKNPTPSIELRLSINLSLDDVGMERLYLELNAIEKGASGLAPIQIHALKRRHLIKIPAPRGGVFRTALADDLNVVVGTPVLGL
jgi:hypothetical protein